MNCDDLSRYGIQGWWSFDGVSKHSIPQSRGVYVIRFPKKIPRFRGTSDILYIGRADRGTLRTRLASHRADPAYWAAPTAFKLRLEELRSYDLHIGWKETLFGDEAVTLERMLLDDYLRWHGELPPLNSRVG